MGLKERRLAALAELQASRRAAAAGEPLPPRTMHARGYSFLLAELGLQVSILGRPVASLDFGLAELRGKLEAHGGPPPYRTEALSEAYTYPALVLGPEGEPTDAYLFFGSDGAALGGEEAQRSDWPLVTAALCEAIHAITPASFEDKVFDPDASSWIYYGVRGGEPFEDVVEGEDPPEWAE